MFLGLNLYAWITIVTIVSMFVVMITTHISIDLVFLAGMAVLFVTGVLSAEEATSGFSNKSVVTIGALFIVIAGLEYSGVIQFMVKYLLGTPRSYPKAIARLMVPVAFLSSFLTNTTVVALFIGVVKSWAKKLHIAPSRLLIPLSYASGMGGVCTLIGTPPNLIISGMYTDDTGVALNIFTTTLPGLFCLAVGILSMIAMRRLLPDRPVPDAVYEEASRYTVEFVVPGGNAHIGQCVGALGLAHLDKSKFIEIIRSNSSIVTPVSDDTELAEGDQLVFAGNLQELLDVKEQCGFVSAAHNMFSLEQVTPKNRQLRSATVAFTGRLVGKRMKDTDFEATTGCALLAVARKGQNINENPYDVVLERGDTLLLDCPRTGFNARALRHEVQFFTSDDYIKIGGRTLVSSLIMIGMVLLSTFGVMPLLQSCFLAALAMVVTRCVPVAKASSVINWQVLMVFAGSICLGLAIERTGIAQTLANALLSVSGDSPFVVLCCICLLGTFITEFISNTACAAMLYPIAYSSAIALGVNPLCFCVALMIAVSSSFATPIGSPTHLLVYGPGGYRFNDFMRVGLPMNFIILAANIFIVYLLFPF